MLDIETIQAVNKMFESLLKSHIFNVQAFINKLLHTVHIILEQLAYELILAFEIMIDGTRRYSRFPGYLAHGRAVETVLADQGKHAVKYCFFLVGYFHDD